MQTSWKKPTKETVEAMNEVVSEMTDINIKPVMPTDAEAGSPADKQVLIRCTEEERESWKKAAESNKETLASYVRRVLNGDARTAMHCQHPKGNVKFYPWAKPEFFCLSCSLRINVTEIGN